MLDPARSVANIIWFLNDKSVIGEAVLSIVTEYLEIDESVRAVADRLDSIDKAYYFVRDKIEYIDDKYDHWQKPKETLRTMKGDCEDKAILLAVILLANEYDAWVRIGRIKRLIDGKVMDHAWVIARLGTEWIELDPSCINCKPGELGFVPIRYIMDFTRDLIKINDPELAKHYIIRH